MPLFPLKTSTLAALAVVIATSSLLTAAAFREKSSSQAIEAEKLVIRSPKGKSTIELGFSKDDVPYLVFQSASGTAMLRLEGGETPTLALNDAQQNPRVHLQGGGAAGMYLRNGQAKTVGSWTVLSDGGAGFGLADGSGSAAAILRGGSSPSVSFFSPENEPMAALGMIQKVPHLLISGPVGNEGILIHGGNPSSMLVVDEAGKVKILISKQGVFQGKEDGGEPAKKREERVFSLEDQKSLFPNLEEQATR